MAKTFRCTVVTPEHQLLSEEVSYASIPAWDGQQGFLPGRAPLLTKLGAGALRLDYEQGGERWFYLGGGFAQMNGGNLTLLAEEAVPAESIVRKDIEAQLREAEAANPATAADREARTKQMARAHGLLSVLDHHG